MGMASSIDWGCSVDSDFDMGIALEQDCNMGMSMGMSKDRDLCMDPDMSSSVN